MSSSSSSSSASQLPPTSPMASQDDCSDDKKLRRREQNRLSAQRSYHKKQERLQVLRGQVSQLQAQYHHHVASVSNNSSSGLLLPPSTTSTADANTRAASPVGSLCSSSAHGSPPPSAGSSSSPVSPSAFQYLLADRAHLQSENDALRRRIDDQTKFQFRMQSLAAGDDATTTTTTTTGGYESLSVIHNSVTGSPRFQPRIKMKRPLTVDECHAIGRHAYQQICKYKFPDHFTSSETAMFGWRDKRVREDGLVKIELTKVFQNKDFHQVAATSWMAVQDPRQMDSLYSLNLNMHSEITQRIDDNNVVMYQSYETAERDPATGKETGAVVVMHHVMLLSLFQTETGYMVIFCSLNPDRLDESDHIVDLAEEEEAVHRGLVKRRRKLWFKKFSWLSLDKAGAQGESTLCKYMFTVPVHHGATYYWPLEILLLVLRYEMAAVGPAILLPSSGGDEKEDNKPKLQSNNTSTSKRQLATPPLPSSSPVVDPVHLLDAMDEEEEEASKTIKIEPLSFNSGAAHVPPFDVSGASGGEDDMDELFVELFP